MVAQRAEVDRLVDALEKLMIIQLGLAKVPQGRIRQIVGGSIERVNRIAKLLRGKGRPS